MIKVKRAKGKIMIYKTLHRKLQIEQHEGLNQECSPEEWGVLAPLVAPVVSFDMKTVLDTNICK